MQILSAKPPRVVGGGGKKQKRSTDRKRPRAMDLRGRDGELQRSALERDEIGGLVKGGKKKTETHFLLPKTKSGAQSHYGPDEHGTVRPWC